jgi:hypothetical protein
MASERLDSVFEIELFLGAIQQCLADGSLNHFQRKRSSKESEDKGREQGKKAFLPVNSS